MTAMRPATAKRWRVLARVLKIIGATGFVVAFSLWLTLISYYTSKRPHAPQPEHGWTVGLTWTHPVSYGTEQDERRSQWLVDLFFPNFCLFAFGEMVKIYKLDDYAGLRTRLNTLES